MVQNKQLSETLGFSVQELTPECTNELDYYNGQGVTLGHCYKRLYCRGCWTETRKSYHGSNGEVVRSVTAFAEAMSKVQKGRAAAFLVRRRGNTFYIGLTIPE